MKVLIINLRLKWFLVSLLFLIYIAFLLFANFGTDNATFMLERHIGSPYKKASHNIFPFATMSTYLFNIHSYNFDNWFYNTFGNILLFIPMGILLPILFAKRVSLWLTIVITMIVSLIIEIMQCVTQLGVFDVDDIIFNTLGGFAGFMLLVLFRNKKRIFK
ncbi:VanZ family protein [Virgibacillus halodenitrificans]|uniref:VanZ family protein n=1 Tax=Virgibacillus halodenitrificans TaxID=1482 RepID=UPI001F2ACDEB|nr:VanZ family protein [Virgibacillus halodenitrificans]MCG1028431.1 VanZ family protein [Virgibacillus halodenitrificans]